MNKNLNVSYDFNITAEKDFLELAQAFVSVIKAVENQGYSVIYHGKELNHTGKIGVLGRPACGKSHFIGIAADQYFAGEVEVSGQTHPSHNQKRDIKLWKRWKLSDGSKEIRLQDDQALSALQGTFIVQDFDDDNYRGVGIFEHPKDPEEFCDAIVRFSYDDQGQRILSLTVSDEVASEEVFVEGFIPYINELS